MRLRTDGRYAYREDVAESIAEFYRANKTKSLISAADDVPRFVEAIESIIERLDLTHQQRQEIIETASTRTISFDAELVDGELQARTSFE